MNENYYFQIFINNIYESYLNYRYVTKYIENLFNYNSESYPIDLKEECFLRKEEIINTLCKVYNVNLNKDLILGSCPRIYRLISDYINYNDEFLLKYLEECKIKRIEYSKNDIISIINKTDVSNINLDKLWVRLMNYRLSGFKNKSTHFYLVYQIYIYQFKTYPKDFIYT